MGRVAKWIDSLTDAQRDAIIQHPDPSYDGGTWWSFQHDCGCLVGCTVAAGGWTTWSTARDGSPSDFEAGYSRFDVIPRRLVVAPWQPLRKGGETAVGERFPELTRRFSPQRMWRIVKARAAKLSRVDIPAVAEEAVA